MKGIFIPALILGLGCMTFPAAMAAPVSSASFEVLGRSLLYGVAADHHFEVLPVSLGVGLSRISGGARFSGDSEPTSWLVPLYGIGTLFSSGPYDRFIWTSGITLLTNPHELNGRVSILGNLRFGSLPFIFNAGVGHEWFRSNGFQMRIQLLLQASANVAPSLGLSLGYAI